MLSHLVELVIAPTESDYELRCPPLMMERFAFNRLTQGWPIDTIDCVIREFPMCYPMLTQLSTKHKFLQLIAYLLFNNTVFHNYLSLMAWTWDIILNLPVSLYFIRKNSSRFIRYHVEFLQPGQRQILFGVLMAFHTLEQERERYCLTKAMEGDQ